MIDDDLDDLCDVPRDVILRSLDRLAREYLSMTGDEFMERLHSGARLPNHPAADHLLMLAGVCAKDPA